MTIAPCVRDGKDVKEEESVSIEGREEELRGVLMIPTVVVIRFPYHQVIANLCCHRR
jgi:hypothetical protein